MKLLDQYNYRKFIAPINKVYRWSPGQVTEYNIESDDYTIFIPNSNLPDKFIVWDFKFKTINGKNFVYMGNFNFHHANTCLNYKPNQVKHFEITPYLGFVEVWVPFVDYVEHLLKSGFVIEGINFPFLFTKFNSK